jgi:TetR/AcrR family transcriptional regulator, transcriptional repressor for nem operon
MQLEQIQSYAIIEAAAELFRSNGYSETNVDDISKQCSIKINNIHHIFEDKIDIAFAVMNHIQLLFDSNILVNAYDKLCSPETRLINLNKAIEEYFIANSGGCVFINFCIEKMNKNTAFVEPIKRYFDSLRNAYLEILETLYQPAEAKLMADDFVADLQGALIMMRVTGGSWPIRRLSDRFLATMQSGVRQQLGDF